MPHASLDGLQSLLSFRYCILRCRSASAPQRLSSTQLFRKRGVRPSEDPSPLSNICVFFCNLRVINWSLCHPRFLLLLHTIETRATTLLWNSPWDCRNQVFPASSTFCTCFRSVQHTTQSILILAGVAERFKSGDCLGS